MYPSSARSYSHGCSSRPSAPARKSFPITIVQTLGSSWRSSEKVRHATAGRAEDRREWKGGHLSCMASPSSRVTSRLPDTNCVLTARKTSVFKPSIARPGCKDTVLSPITNKVLNQQRELNTWAIYNTYSIKEYSLMWCCRSPWSFLHSFPTSFPSHLRITMPTTYTMGQIAMWLKIGIFAAEKQPSNESFHLCYPRNHRSHRVFSATVLTIKWMRTAWCMCLRLVVSSNFMAASQNSPRTC